MRVNIYPALKKELTVCGRCEVIECRCKCSTTALIAIELIEGILGKIVEDVQVGQTNLSTHIVVDIGNPEMKYYCLNCYHELRAD